MAFRRSLTFCKLRLLGKQRLSKTSISRAQALLKNKQWSGLSSRTLSTSPTCFSSNNPEFTSVRYPYVKRGKYAKLTAEDVKFFEKLMPGEGRVFTSPDDVEGYNVDWMRIVRGE